MPPSVSIIIGNYNYGSYLYECIESALNQTYQSCEVIVIDDCSEDNSFEIVQSFSGDVAGFRNHRNMGQAFCYNRGFSKCHGDYILFLDSDDVLEENAAAVAVQLMLAENPVKVHWPMVVVDKDGVPTGKLLPDNALPSGDHYEEVRLNGPESILVCPASGNMYSRDYVCKVLPLDTECYRTGADTPLIFKAPFYGSIAATEVPLARYRQHGGNDSFSLSLRPSCKRGIQWFERYAVDLVELEASRGNRIDINQWRLTSWWHSRYRILECLEGYADRCDLIVIDDYSFLAIDNGKWLRLDHPANGCSDLLEQFNHFASSGASILIIVGSCFYWKDLYPDFFSQLERSSLCLVTNRDLDIFSLLA